MCEKYLVRLKKKLWLPLGTSSNMNQHKEKDFTPVSFEHLKVSTRLCCVYNF